MGGRGRSAGKGGRQYSFDDELFRSRIAEIIGESKRSIAALASTGNSIGGANPQMLYKKCACCGEYTIPAGTEYQICPICGWIDDPNQNKNPEEMNGMNNRSLKQAREDYLKKIKRK